MFVCRKLSKKNKKKNCVNSASQLSNEHQENSFNALFPRETKHVVIDYNTDSASAQGTKTANDDAEQNIDLPDKSASKLNDDSGTLFPSSMGLNSSSPRPTRTSQSNSLRSMGSDGSSSTKSRCINQVYADNKDGGSEISVSSFETRSRESAGRNISCTSRVGQVNQVYIGNVIDAQDLSASAILSPRSTMTSRSNSTRSIGSAGSNSSRRSRRVNQAYAGNDNNVQDLSASAVLLSGVTPRHTKTSRSNSSRSLGSAGSSGSHRSQRINYAYISDEEKKSELYESILDEKENYSTNSLGLTIGQSNRNQRKNIQKKKTRRTTRVNQVHDDVVKNMDVLSDERCTPSRSPGSNKREMIRKRSTSGFSAGSGRSLSRLSSIRESQEQAVEV